MNVNVHKRSQRHKLGRGKAPIVTWCIHEFRRSKRPKALQNRFIMISAVLCPLKVDLLVHQVAKVVVTVVVDMLSSEHYAK